MKKYSIESLIMLDFITHNSQNTYKFNKGDGFVEWDEKNTIWYIDNDNKKYETINMVGLLEAYIRDKRLIEIKC